jgi:type II secretory pathway component PulF
MLYHYIATDSEGKLQEADYEAATLEEALRFLAGRELRPVSVKPLTVNRGMWSRSFGKITLADKVFLTKYLSLMMRVGTDLLAAINILIADFDKPAMKNFLLEVRENLTRGRPFYEIFAKYPKVFSPVFVNLLKAAEASGTLQTTFEKLSTSLTKEAELKNKVRAALIYPVIILSASLGLFVFLVTFALPKLAAVFMSGGLNPPGFSKVVFGVGLFVGDHVVGFLAVLFGGLGLFFYFFFKNRVGKRIADRVLRKTPIIKNLYREIAVQRFASTLAALLSAGLPIIDSVKITAKVVNAPEFHDALMRIADEGLAKGLTIGDSFRREPAFPKVVVNLIAISEKAGHLSEVLETLADFYASNVDNDVKTLVSFLEPALLLFMGIVVGGIAISIIIPIYQLTSQF